MAGNENSGRADIVKVSKPFGTEGAADPSAAATKRNKEQNPSSIRMNLRRLAAAEFDITSPLTKEEIAKKFGRKGTEINGAQVLALKKFEMALKGNTAIMQQVTDDIDGKQVQATVEARTSLADLVNASVALERQQQQSVEAEQASDEQPSG